jgi:predicted enzyme related to lactoylglutathione lyase
VGTTYIPVLNVSFFHIGVSVGKIEDRGHAGNFIFQDIEGNKFDVWSELSQSFKEKYNLGIGEFKMIKNQMNGVFVHVTNLRNSVKWYATLLGLDIELEQVKSPVFNMPIVGTTSLTLDDHTFDPNFKHSASPSPLFNFYAPDIDSAYQYIKDKGIEVVREIEWVGVTAWFNIKDPDGNVVMICNC